MFHIDFKETDKKIVSTMLKPMAAYDAACTAIPAASTVMKTD